MTRAILLALCLSLASCGPAQGGRDPSAVVQTSLALAFNAAVAALVWCDTREAIYLEALVNHLNQGGAVPKHLLEAAEVRVKRIEAAAQALAVARAWLAGERSEAEGVAALRDAVRVLHALVLQLRAEGVDVPRSVDEGLAQAAAILGAKT